ncbi:hypothetical protein MKY20_25730 [Cytobacillus sp. FSL W8-0315]|uniref:hypothetical protein n=1 Tax=Cytobacillus sp. FSL W8-0315 TaxID=2921600 RepID=UPI0030FBB16A
MKLKSLIIGASLISIVTIGSVFAINSNKPIVEVEYYGHGKREVFENLETMEDKATLIVVGEKLSKEEPTILTDGVEGEDGYEGVIGGFTISDFMVKKVLKNTTGDDITKASIIPILENAATDTIGDGKKKIIYSNDGYELMKKGKHYILFMDESSSDPGTYIPLSGIYGKAPLEGQDEELEFNGDDKFVKKETKDAVKKYKQEMKAIK